MLFFCRKVVTICHRIKPSTAQYLPRRRPNETAILQAWLVNARFGNAVPRRAVLANQTARLPPLICQPIAESPLLPLVIFYGRNYSWVNPNFWSSDSRFSRRSIEQLPRGSKHHRGSGRRRRFRFNSAFGPQSHMARSKPWTMVYDRNRDSSSHHGRTNTGFLRRTIGVTAWGGI